MTVTAETSEEHVVLADAHGRPAGTAPKASVHHRETPLHLAFSCHVVDSSGRVLLARRAAGKRTWPATWSNACCGHPQLGETLREAVVRRLADELGLVPRRLGLAIPDFAYRAVMEDGTTEHELCPVVVAEVEGDPSPNCAEVDAVQWVAWDELRHRADAEPWSLSPWSVLQIEGLAALAPSPRQWLEQSAPGGLLDHPVGRPEPLDGAACSIEEALAAARGPVEERLLDFVRAGAVQFGAADPAVSGIADAVRRLVERGGKRLRPAFVHWGHAATGAPRDDRVVTVAAAIELLHTFALLHDDVMDRSATRRGAPAAQVSLAAARPGPSGHPDAGWFGASAAILAGDLAFLWADELLDQAGGGGAMDRARVVFNRLRSEVIAGQYLDLRLAAEPRPSEMAARRVALLKTARYTVSRPLQIGAALGAGSPELDCVLETYGDAVGTAFQLRDDVLGLFGDPAVTGKSRLDDLREGKRTLLVVRAFALGDDRQRSTILAALGDPGLDEEGAARCRDAVAASGALASVEALTGERHDAAVRAVSGLGGQVREALVSLAAFAAFRTA